MSKPDRPMEPSQQLEEELFARLLDKPAVERAAFLDGACHGDPALRQRLEALLAAHEQSNALHPRASGPDGPTMKLDLAEDADDDAVGQCIGRYKLREKVGEGGCGVVYVAEQTEPVRRRVALKVIKLGMDTKAVVARFEAERQALALMDHPNIAKVLDAGSTDGGRPYFVMELVRGIKITEYCDQNKLSTEARLDLFIKVCHAIQHAHQKGIIHRDIKPSNILVTLHDGVPIPRVIDFGIAKATEGRLTDATVYTQLHQFIGTPAYMSPEQAEMSGLDVDTRSDIYSLGVLLYELLTGKTPFDPKVLTAHGIDAMRRFIREEEPQRPSTRLSTLAGDELTTTASRRSVDAPKLAHLLRGDLDWIVMKCLEKDRTRRYETANALAMDLKRYLNQELVVARPPSRLYRFQKAVRRNKLAFAATAAVAIALALAGTASTWLAIRAMRARHNAEAAAAREKSLRLEAESRTTMTKAQNRFAELDYAGAYALVSQLPDSYVHAQAEAVAPMLRALGNWLGGQMRWEESAACYNSILLGPARQGTGPEVGALNSLLPITLSQKPTDLAFLEYGPVLLELDDVERYEQLRDSAVDRYSKIERKGYSPVDVRAACERVLHGCLLSPPLARHRVTFCKWAALVKEGDPSGGFEASALALFELRRGNPKEALDWADKTLTSRGALLARGHVLVAVAYTDLSQQDSAKAALDQAHEQIDRMFQTELGAGQYGNLWADWLIDRVLLREADKRFASMTEATNSSRDRAGQESIDQQRRSWDEAMERARSELASAAKDSTAQVERTSR